MERRDTQTPKRPDTANDRNDDSNREKDAKRNPGDTGQRKNEMRLGERHESTPPRRQADDELDDETSSTPGGNPARGTPPGTTIPTPSGSIREHQSPGCEGLCSGDESKQPLGERDNAENRPL
jgi:hypothetical protein